MLKYFAKIFKDIFPSVLATVIGAFIVNHYIIAKPATESPAAQTAPAETKTAPAEAKTAPAETKDARPAEVAHQTPPRVKAKEKANKPNTDKPLVEKPAEPDTKPAETAVAHGRPPEKAVAKVTPAPVVAAPAVSAPAADPASPASAAGATPDANDLARAAIERLNKASSAAPHEMGQKEVAQKPAPGTAHVQEAPRVQEPRPIVVAVPSVRPLPPVTAPPAEGYGTPPSNPPYTASVGSDDPDHPTPPADIPLSADATSSARTNDGHDVFSAAKSVFHGILPKPN